MGVGPTVDKDAHVSGGVAVIARDARIMRSARDNAVRDAISVYMRGKA